MRNRELAPEPGELVACTPKHASASSHDRQTWEELPSAPQDLVGRRDLVKGIVGFSVLGGVACFDAI